MGNSPVDRDAKYMKKQWGTTRLATDYFIEENMATQNDFLDNLANHQHQKMLREISNDDLTPKKGKIHQEGEIFSTESDPEPLYE